MQPTYSFTEIKSLIRSLDVTDIFILEEIVEEERECFSELQLKAFHKFMQLKNKSVVRNELQFEYLLSYN